MSPRYLYTYQALRQWKTLQLQINLMNHINPSIWNKTGKTLTIAVLFLIVKPDLQGFNYAHGQEIENNLQTTFDTNIQRPSSDRKPEIKNLEFIIQDLDYPLVDLNTIAESENEITIELAADILFDFDESTLKPPAIPSLKDVIEKINDSSSTTIKVEGHTDSKETNAYNQILSQKRAISVRDWLINNGRFNPQIFTIKGYGETKPIEPNQTDDGDDNPSSRQRNRRVEITIKTSN